MEVLFIFLLVAATVLGFLCLIVLEYQNRRTRQWQHFKITHQIPPSVPASPAPTPAKRPNPREPARVA